MMELKRRFCPRSHSQCVEELGFEYKEYVSWAWTLAIMLLWGPNTLVRDAEILIDAE